MLFRNRAIWKNAITDYTIKTKPYTYAALIFLPDLSQGRSAIVAESLLLSSSGPSPTQ